MDATIDCNFSKNNKVYLNSQLSNLIECNQDEFLINSRLLFEYIKREYQYFFLNDSKENKKLENKSQKGKYLSLDEDYVKNYINKKKCLDEINDISRDIKNAQLKKNYPTDSLHDLFNDVKQSIAVGKNDYLDVFKEIFSKYMDFVRELREILSELGNATKAGSKDGYININIVELLYKLNVLKSKLNKPGFFSVWMFFNKDDDGRFFRIINGEKVYYESNTDADNAVDAVDKLLSQIKGITSQKNDNSGTTRPNISFLFNVGLDLSGLDKLIDYLKQMPQGEHDILQTEFDLLKKTLDAFEKGVNTNLDELSKKYSAANSNYDNFVKIVSSTMNTLLEMARGFLKF